MAQRKVTGAGRVVVNVGIDAQIFERASALAAEKGQNVQEWLRALVGEEIKRDAVGRALDGAA